MFKPMVVDIYRGDVVTSFDEAYGAGIRGIIHKASQGSTFKDNRYEDRRDRAVKAGMLWGAYHFGDDSDVESQVTNFLDTIGDYKGMLLALDFEPNPKGGTMSLKQARQWLEMVEDKTGQTPVLYSGHLIKEKLGEDSDGFWGKHRLWLAQYASAPKLPDAWSEYFLWQYAADGFGPQPHSIPGIQGEIDLNVFNGDENALKEAWAPAISAKTDVSTPVETDEKSENETDDLPWMKLAKELIGTKEAPGDEDNQTIIQWARDLGIIKDYNSDSIPWCGLFMSHIMSEIGEDVPDVPLWALSWKSYGTRITDSAYGAILVFKRAGGGHVGFYVSEDDDNYHVLGGNQNDMVCIKKVAKANCVAMRWPTDHLDILKRGAIQKKLDEPIISNAEMS